MHICMIKRLFILIFDKVDENSTPDSSAEFLFLLIPEYITNDNRKYIRNGLSCPQKKLVKILKLSNMQICG